MPNFDDWSIEAIEDYRIERRDKMRVLKAEIAETKEAYERKIILLGLGARLRMNVDDMTTKDAKALIDIINKTPRTGDVIVEVETADVALEGQEAKVN